MSTTVTQTGWNHLEIQISHQVLQKAYGRETATLMAEVKNQTDNMTNIEQLWQVHDLLSAKRHDLDGKYDNRESMLVFTFAQLLKEGWISLEELNGLDSGKLAKISSLSKM